MLPKYIVIHTAAFRGKNCDALKIDQWHRDRGWSGIGYHYVILNNQHESKNDGTLEEGRPLSRNGAHTLGINNQSVGICCVGHGDHEDFTSAQYESLFRLLTDLLKKLDIPVKNVIGHREINRLVDLGLVDVRYRTQKTCPGGYVNMDALRVRLKQYSNDSEPDTVVASKNLAESNVDIVSAIKTLKNQRESFVNARDELDEFLFHPEIIEMQNIRSKE